MVQIRNLVFLSLLIFQSAQAFVLYSPFPSKIETETTITIRNARFVNKDIRILRSMRPFIKELSHRNDPDNVTDMVPYPKYLEQILNYGVTDILIFKDPERGRDDIQLEKDALAGKMEDADPAQNATEDFSKKGVRSILFPWKDFQHKEITFQKACAMSVRALRIIKAIKDDSHRKILFHCTVGEDRTGYLAFLVALMNESPTAANEEVIKKVFDEEACLGGFSTGNAGKEAPVTDAIKVDLIPLAIKMAYKIYSREINWNNLDDVTLCTAEPTIPATDTHFALEAFVCAPSIEYPRPLLPDPHLTEP
jgi:hypothetical protein